MLLGGHDTTSSTVSVSTHLDFNLVQSVDFVFQYCFLLLSQNPEIRQRVREEHDQVFDPDLNRTIEILKQTSNNINELPLTTAVVKEILRMYPPGSTFRAAKNEYVVLNRLLQADTETHSAIITFNGGKYPTKGHVVSSIP
jgi:cytochrome P450